VNVTALGDWLSWIQYISITRYSLNVSKRSCIANYVIIGETRSHAVARIADPTASQQTV